MKLDRDFVAVADLRQYHVFLTPYGDSNGLYVSNRSSSGFQVREQGGGKSSLKFSYRVVAKRANVTVRRFQKVKPPERPNLATAIDRSVKALDAFAVSGRQPTKKKRTK